MSIESAGDSASLGDIIVSCTCRKIATMESAFSKNAMKGVAHCSGRRPWLSEPDASCDQVPRTLQRGASNVWFLVHAFIYLDPAVVRRGFPRGLTSTGSYCGHLRDRAALRAVLDSMNLAADTMFSTDDLVEAVQSSGQVGEAADDDDVTRSLKRDEYLALVHGRPNSR